MGRQNVYDDKSVDLSSNGRLAVATDGLDVYVDLYLDLGRLRKFGRGFDHTSLLLSDELEDLRVIDIVSIPSRAITWFCPSGHSTHNLA